MTNDEQATKLLRSSAEKMHRLTGLYCEGPKAAEEYLNLLVSAMGDFMLADAYENAHNWWSPDTPPEVMEGGLVKNLTVKNGVLLMLVITRKTPYQLLLTYTMDLGIGPDSMVRIDDASDGAKAYASGIGEPLDLAHLVNLAGNDKPRG